jgi:hypothetical protein
MRLAPEIFEPCRPHAVREWGRFPGPIGKKLRFACQDLAPR